MGNVRVTCEGNYPSWHAHLHYLTWIKLIDSLSLSLSLSLYIYIYIYMLLIVINLEISWVHKLKACKNSFSIDKAIGSDSDLGKHVQGKLYIFLKCSTKQKRGHHKNTRKDFLKTCNRYSGPSLVLTCAKFWKLIKFLKFWLEL